MIKYAATHTESDGLALSQDGSLAAAAAWSRPANSILLLDLLRGAPLVALRADEDLSLYDVRFASEHELLFVSRGLSRPYEASGGSQIWLFDRRTKQISAFGPAKQSRLLRLPALSLDRTKVFYFASAGLGVIERTQFYLFQWDIAAKSESRLGDMHFSFLRSLYPSDSCVIVDVGTVQRGSKKELDALSPVTRGGIPKHAPSADDVFCVSLADQSVEKIVQDSNRASSLRLVGVLTNGDVVFSQSTSPTLLRLRGVSFSELMTIPKGQSIGPMAVSGDGRTVVRLQFANNELLLARSTLDGTGTVPLVVSERAPTIEF